MFKKFLLGDFFRYVNIFNNFYYYKDIYQKK